MCQKSGLRHDVFCSAPKILHSQNMSLPSANKKTLGKIGLCRVQKKTLSKDPLCRVFFFYFVFYIWVAKCLKNALGKERDSGSDFSPGCVAYKLMISSEYLIFYMLWWSISVNTTQQYKFSWEL